MRKKNMKLPPPIIGPAPHPNTRLSNELLPKGSVRFAHRWCWFHLVDLNWCSLTQWILNYAIETNVSQPCLQKTHLNLNKYPSKLTLLGKSLLEKLFWCEKRNRDEFLLPISTNNRHPVQFLFGMLQKIWCRWHPWMRKLYQDLFQELPSEMPILLLGGCIC